MTVLARRFGRRRSRGSRNQAVGPAPQIADVAERDVADELHRARQAARPLPLIVATLRLEDEQRRVADPDVQAVPGSAAVLLQRAAGRAQPTPST